MEHAKLNDIVELENGLIMKICNDYADYFKTVDTESGEEVTTVIYDLDEYCVGNEVWGYGQSKSKIISIKEENKNMIKLGQKAKDKLTGFEGILYGKASYLTGCDQYCLVPSAKDGEIKSSQWFDEGRIEIIGEGVTVQDVTAEKNGGPNRDCPR
jgi:hypothetical protein